jgi:hypothetical protein
VTKPSQGAGLKPDKESSKGKSHPKTKDEKRKLGLQGLLVSVGIHSFLVLIAFFWVISSWTDFNRAEPSTFTTGSGGGNNGEKALIREHKIERKKATTLAKEASRITSKSADASISLPSLPISQTVSLNAGLMSGGSSKGFGGGSGGGIGAGRGAGVGNGVNFVGKPVMGARIVAQRVAVYMDASNSMERYLDRVEAEIKKQFPEADIYLYSGIWVNVADGAVVGGKKYDGPKGRGAGAGVRETKPESLTSAGRVIFKKYDANFRQGDVGAWIDIMRDERAYDALVIFSDFQDGVSQYRSSKSNNSSGLGEKIYWDGMRSTDPSDRRKPEEKRWENDWVKSFADALKDKGPRLYCFSTQVEPQPIFSRCVDASKGQIKMVTWLRTGGKPPPEDPNAAQTTSTQAPTTQGRPDR